MAPTSPVTVTVLGAGDAFGSHGRFQAAYLITAGNKKILMEAGPTLLPSMKRNAASPADLDLVLISHLHGDHFNGLGYLILEYAYESPRKRSLTVAGPPGLEERTWALFRAMYREFRAAARMKTKLKFVALDPRRPARISGVAIESLRTPHTVKDISLAFRVTLEGKSIVFSGDTGWTDELIGFSAGADLFLCECTYFQTQLDFHLSYPQIAANRDRFTARRMVLTHIGREVLERSSEVALEMAFDGMTIEL